KVRFRARRQEQFRALRAVDPVTKDVQRIALMMNAGLLVDLPQLSESGAEGIVRRCTCPSSASMITASPFSASDTTPAAWP
ncbi:hypothetical protein ACC713_37535, partial [Rhizobium johnstonii]|uniref:hypothetical protein n=1 Tax=Rhizobium johnstonii TaxID=3019933 RepID=UPI003F98DD0F